MADDEVKQYFMLEFEFEKGLTSLKLKGPEIPNTLISPTIKVYKKDGKFVFEIGVQVYEFDSEEVGEKLKALFGEGKSSNGPFGPVKIGMPSKSDLKLAGTYMSFEDYERKVKAMETSVKVGIGSRLFPKMPKPLYEALIRQYRLQDAGLADGNPLYL